VPCSVVKLFPVNQFAPTPEAQIAYLETVIDDIRSGRTVIERAAIIIQPPTGSVWVEPFGQQCTTMEMVGLLEYGKACLMAPDD
jgi:hypothetical protein